jgi:dimethylamine monooxygenase subunit A
MHLPPHNLFLEAKTVEASENSTCYFPLENGRYEVKPGFIPLGKSLGDGEADKRVFQFDGNCPHYRHVKVLSRGERLSKYYQTYNYSDKVAGAIACLIINRLSQEYPQYFHCQPTDRGLSFHNQLTGETLYIDEDWRLQQVQNQGQPVAPPYTSTLDALATQVQEDITVMSYDPNGHNWLSAVHLCYPNYWSAEEKIGKDFITIHAPVAGIEKINRRASAIVNTMLLREPMVRFAWGLSTDTRLNHHPEPPPSVSAEDWNGRSFNPNNPKLFLRIERQVIWGLPEHNAVLFTIRTYFRDCRTIKKDPNLQLKLFSALQSMTPESLIYKGLAESRDSILAWLKEM